MIIDINRIRMSDLGKNINLKTVKKGTQSTQTMKVNRSVKATSWDFSFRPIDLLS